MANTEYDNECSTVVMNENNIVDDTNVCVICLEELDDQVINYNCKHIIHTHCLLDYVKSQIKNKQDIICPICRNVECCVGSKHYETVKQLFGCIIE